jgi:hypothetical protein
LFIQLKIVSLSNQLKPNIMYLIETGNSIEDVENGCVKPSNAEFTKERALETLEKRYGGTMIDIETGRQFESVILKIE